MITVKLYPQTLQLEFNGSHYIFPRITAILKRDIINSTKTRYFNTIRRQTINIPWYGRLPQAIPPSWRKNWSEGTLIGLAATTQRTSESVPHMTPAYLVLQTSRQQITLETAEKCKI